MDETSFDGPELECDCDCPREMAARLLAEAALLRELVEALEDAAERLDLDLRDRTSLSVAVVKVLEAERMVLGTLAHLDPTFVFVVPQLLEIALYYRKRLLVELPPEALAHVRDRLRAAAAREADEEDLWRAARDGHRDGSLARLGAYELPLTMPQARRLAADLRKRWPLARGDLRSAFR